MKNATASLLLLSGLTASFHASSTAHDAGKYLGQTPPGLVPSLFAPGVVSTPDHRETEVLFLPDMSELSFTRLGGEYKEPTWIVLQYKDEQWIDKPIEQSQVEEYKAKFSPELAQLKQHAVFKDIPVVGFTTSASGTQYFYEMDFRDGSGHMSYSRLVKGQYETPQKMSSAVNRGKYIAHPYVAPDESYLMWDAEKMDEDTPDIYISFRQKDGTWGDAINMGDAINTPAYEQRPKVSPDGKYLFFWRGDKKQREDGSTYWEGNPYWVDVKIIDTLRPKS